MPLEEEEGKEEKETETEKEKEEEKSSVELTILRAVGLLGDHFYDKLDSFIIVKLGRGKEISRDDAKGHWDGVGFRTPTQTDKGPNPEINASGKLVYRDEEGLEFYVYSENVHSNTLVGVGFLPKAQFLTEAFRGEVALAGAFSGKGASKAAGLIVLDVKHVLVAPSVPMTLSMPLEEEEEKE